MVVCVASDIDEDVGEHDIVVDVDDVVNFLVAEVEDSIVFRLQHRDVSKTHAYDDELDDGDVVDEKHDDYYNSRD